MICMKRFLSLFLALVMSFALAIPAFAIDNGDPDEGIMTLGLRCNVCGGNVSMHTEWDKTPIVKDSQECVHGFPYGDDVIYEYQGMYYEVCVDCKQGFSRPVSRTETKCFGHYA